MPATSEPGRFVEVNVSVVTVVALVAIEAALFEPNRVRDDAVDIMTLSAFGGFAAGGLRDSIEHDQRRIIAVGAVLGLVASLAILHGTKGDVASSGFVRALSVAIAGFLPSPPLFTWDTGIAIGGAIAAGGYVCLAAVAVQLVSTWTPDSKPSAFTLALKYGLTMLIIAGCASTVLILLITSLRALAFILIS